MSMRRVTFEAHRQTQLCAMLWTFGRLPERAARKARATTTALQRYVT